MNISSNNKRVLVVSDIHQNTTKFHTIVKSESPDIVVCLGDWFDSHSHDVEQDWYNTAKYLLKYVKQPNAYTLWGNHDLQYFYTNNRLKCTGYSANKDNFVTDLLYPNFDKVRQKFLWYLWIDDWLCTHAGLHPNHLDPIMSINKVDITNFLNKSSELCDINIKSDQYHWFYGVGKARGGFDKYGGIVWCDFRKEYKPIDGLKQIVGHTHSDNNWIVAHKSEGNNNLQACNNICIDTELNEYLIISNGVLEIKKYTDIFA